jgi:hypothetical protein
MVRQVRCSALLTGAGAGVAAYDRYGSTTHVVGSPVDQLAQELWEAHATHHQAVIDFPQEHWDQLDAFTRGHWRYIARVGLAFRPQA